MDLEKYPNLEAILNGTVAGSFRDWIAVRPELEKLVAEMAEVSKLRERVAELEAVLRLVQQWGKDSRSVGAYEVFQEVVKALDPVTVVDCTCVPCICPPITKDDRCLGCGARTCMAHELALKSSCASCESQRGGQMGPTHRGSSFCESGSIAGGGNKSHCTCDVCF